jgi:hypothetical protein
VESLLSDAAAAARRTRLTAAPRLECGKTYGALRHGFLASASIDGAWSWNRRLKPCLVKPNAAIVRLGAIENDVLKKSLQPANLKVSEQSGISR